MVRAKVVKHPRKWEHGGYHEIVRPKQRYRTINRKEVTRLLDVEEKELGRQYQGWIKEALKQGNLRRNAVWSSELAVGDDEFVEKVKKSVGAWFYPACRVKPFFVSLGEMFTPLNLLLFNWGSNRSTRRDFTGVAKMAVNEDPALYGQSLDIKENYLDWQIFDENDL